MKTLVLFCFCVITLAFSNGECPEYWIEYEDACFLFSHYSDTWLGAENHCKQFGNAYLATVDSAEKMKFFQDILIVLGHLGHHSHWIGGSDYTIEGSWRWLKSGLGIKFFDWGPGEPNGSDTDEKDCIAIVNYNGTYQWSDEDCESRRQPRNYYVCEQPHTAATSGPTIG